MGFFFFFEIYFLFMVSLGLHCCMPRLLCSCGVWASHEVASLVEHRPWTHGLQQLHLVGFGAWMQQLGDGAQLPQGM